MKLETARRIYRVTGIWDLVLTLPFALPFVNGAVIGLLSSLNTWISPQRAFPEFGEIHLFFVQLFGILAVIWALVRIHRPDRFLASYDTIGRIVVASCMIAFTLGGGSFVPSLFSVSEISFGILQAIALIRTNSQKNVKL